ncbi:MAG: hypothetical protein PHQ22_03805 [Sulfuricurvum sp.]|nr:hypothetical protein [Sulfuricurvum sp.]MDD5386300.1 hypothetical protein [Sulfuricurvum sp.]
MAENKYLKKFIPEDYISGNSLIADYEGNISIVDNRITFAYLEFDAKVKINTNCLVLSKDTNDILDQEIYSFKGKNDDDSTYPVTFETLNYEFTGCVFNNNVNFNPLENSTATVDYCTFKKYFYINDEYDHDNKKIKINQIIIENSTFENDFGIYKAEINTIKIKNVDFEALSEFNEVVFQEEFDFREITYKGFTLFDKCIFNTKAEFEYIIFEKFTSFRGSMFNKGVTLDYTSGDKEINFFGINGLESKESKENTSRETYRIIKNNFEKIGNKIEANKYHALELDQKRRELEKNKWQNKLDYIVFKLHDLSSEHSTNWFLALFWIFIVSFFTNIWLSNELSINCLFKYINILSKIEDFGDSYLAMVFNKVSLGYLYYQFLTAVRKDTRK